MKLETKKLIKIAAVLFGLYLIFRYWPNIEGMIILGISAAVPLAIGCAIAYVVNILMTCYEKGYTKFFGKSALMKYKRLICLILAMLSLAAIIFFAIYMVLPELINCIASFVALVPGVVAKAVTYIQEEKLLERIPALQDALSSINSENIIHTVEQFWNTYKDSLGGAVGSIVSAVSGIFSAVVGVVVGLIFSIYVMFEKEKLLRQGKLLVRTYLPKKADRIMYIGKVLNESFHHFIVGQCTEAVVLGLLCILGMFVLRIPYAVMIGVFIGFTALIPIAGAYIGAAVGAVMILTVSPIKALEFVIFIVILQQIEGNLIYPKVVGKSIGLPGIWVLTAITIGGGIMGIPGMLVAVPLFSAVYRLIKEDVSLRAAKKQEEIKKFKKEESKAVTKRQTKEKM